LAVSKTTDDAFERAQAESWCRLAELARVYDCRGNVVAPAVERTDFALTPDNPTFAGITGEPTIMLLAPYEEFLIREMRRLSIHPRAVIEMLEKKQA
jgi:hypothetical protein